MPKLPKSPKHPKVPLWKKGIVAVATLGIIAGSATVAKRVIDPTELVMGVIDGDTFVIGNEQRVRLFDADSPEPSYCYGEESKIALTDKIMGKRVILKNLSTDVYGRIVANVYLDGEFVNEYMVKNGYAVSHRDPGLDTNLIKVAGIYAKQNKIGLFSEQCYQPNPPNPKCIIKGNITQDKNTKIYFVPGCNHYTQTIIEKFLGEDYFCTEKEAQEAGFTKSPECK